MKKRFLALVMIAAMAVSMVACGSGESDSSGDSKGSGGTKEVYMFLQSAEIADGLKKTTDIYSEAHPEVTFTIETNADDYWTNLKTKIQSGETPDVIQLNGYSDAETYSEYLVDLSDQEWVEDMSTFTRENVTVDGAICGVPMGVQAIGYVYNAGLFEQAGITETPKNLTELKEACKKLEAIGVEPISETYMDGYQGGYFFMNEAIALQDDPFTFMEGLTDGTSEISGNEAFEMVADLLEYDYSVCKNPMNTDYNTRIAALANEEVAMTCGGNWLQIPLLEVDDSLDFKIMGIPVGESGDYDYISLTCSYWGLTNTSDVQDEVKDFFNWIAKDPEGQQLMLENLQLIPGFTTFSADAETVGTIGATISEYIENDKAIGSYSTYFPDGVADAWGEDVQKFVAGQITREEFFQELEDDWYDIAN